MENNKDFDYIKAQLDTLPAVTLPTSLSAESLWARVDAGGLAADEPSGQGRVAEFVRRFRPVLSYAAVFVVMVVVYYSAGLDSSPVNIQSQMDSAPRGAAEAAQEPMTMMASPKMVEPPADAPAPEPAPAPRPEPRMVTGGAQSSSNEAGIASAQAETNADTDYTKSADDAAAMENYLKAALSPGDYGGIYLLHGDNAAELHIWVVNRDAVDMAAALYTGEGCTVVMETARCSLEALETFAASLELISLKEGEALSSYISEMDNAIAVNITKSAEARLRGEIDLLSQINGIPTECINLFTVDP